MKFILVIAVVVIAFYIWRSNRERQEDNASERQAPRPKAPHGPAVAGPQEMVRCAVCDLHLPRADAHAGRVGLYCSEEHRLRGER